MSPSKGGTETIDDPSQKTAIATPRGTTADDNLAGPSGATTAETMEPRSDNVPDAVRAVHIGTPERLRGGGLHGDIYYLII